MRPRYGRRLASSSGKDDGLAAITGHRHGHRSRTLTGALGGPRSRCRGRGLLARTARPRNGRARIAELYQRRTLVADALIASAYLAGTNTRRVRRALKALFAEGIGKDVVSRVWRRVKSDWDAWNALFARRGADCAADPRRNRRSRPARSESHVYFAASRHRRARGRREDVAGDQEHGRRKHGRLARLYLTDQAWSAATAVPHRRRRAGIGEGACRRLQGCHKDAPCTNTGIARPRARAPA